MTCEREELFLKEMRPNYNGLKWNERYGRFKFSVNDFFQIGKFKNVHKLVSIRLNVWIPSVKNNCNKTCCNNIKYESSSRSAALNTWRF